ncbi:MAG: beta strand repeat-containing protein, partial [Gemmataceae bacterium]
IGGIVTVLPNGNYVVLATSWDNGTVKDVGAVTFGSGITGVRGVVSSSNSLVGTNSNDSVGTSLRLLPNGNFLVTSDNWNGTAGAFTWVDGNVGLTGAVSSANSLVGSYPGDTAQFNISILENGNYVINVPNWDGFSSATGRITDVGASFWANGWTGLSGVISAANSLVGSSAYDQVGLNITNLANGNYILPNTKWDNGTKAVDVGAVTWVDGNRGITGTITSANSRLGTTANQYDSFQVVTLSNGNYVILAPKWDNGNVLDAGAVTFANGSQPLTGTISSANSLVGTTANQFSFAQVKALSNGNYVVYTPLWDSSTTVDVGALTWGSGTTGVTGTISSSNSLVGSKQDDFLTISNQEKVYTNNPTELIGNGNIVFVFNNLDNGSVADAGAVVWMSGSQPTTGVIGSNNSLVGSKTGDLFGASINRLPNGNYVVASTFWDNGSVVDAGAVTWGNGSTGIFGSISSSNSLVGTTDTKLSSIRFNLLEGSSNYLISNPTGTVNGIAGAGFVTWANGTAPLTGTISSANSLVGSSANDNVGNNLSSSLFIFANGNYGVISQYWNEKRGAITFGNGNTGVVGVISEQNSLVGTSPNDQIGLKFSRGSADAALLISGLYDDPSRNLANVGAVTLFDGNIGTTGKVNSTNSYIGNIASSSTASILTTYDPYNRKFYAYFANEAVAGFSNNGAINPSVIQPNINTAPTFTSPNNKTFKVGNNDSFQIVAKGLPEEITYSLQSGNLPNGITLTAQGLLSGTAVAGAGAIYNLTVRATNSTGFTDQSFTLTVTEEPVITSTGPLPAFVIGSNVANYPFTATGFPAPTFSTNDALPKGVTLNPSTGLLSGTPVNGTEGTYEFTLIASSGENLVAKKTFSLTVNSPVNFTSAGGTSAHNGVASTFQVKTTGVPPANNFSLTGSVPTGVTIDNNGLISIASTTLAGNYSFSVNASNGFGSPATQPFTLEVFGPPSITSSNNASFTIGTVGSFPFSASGNPNTFTFSTSDALPAGLVLSAQGVLSGTPEDGSSGSFTVDVKAFNGVSSTSQSFTIQIAKAASSVSLVSGSNGSVNPGTPVTLTATVTGGSNQKAGTVTFKDGSTVIGTAKVDPGTGVATLITDALASGSHNLTAEYSGNTAFLPSSSNTVTQVVRTVSTTTVTSSNLSAAYQSSVTFTATLGSTNATGTVDFYDGSTRIAQGVALSSGVATFTTSNLSAGSHSITAVYNGDSSFTTSTSSAIIQSVIATSSTALASSASSAVAYNTAVTFTATVTGSAGTPTGTVQFYIGDTALGSPVTLNGSGVATYTSLVNSGSNANVPLPAGNLGIRAVYSGDSSYSNSTSSVVTQVVNATTATVVSSAGGSSLLGSTATFVARVTNTSGANSPTAALVSFYEGSILLGTASASPVATTNYSEATFTISNLGAGNRSITAVYAGDPQTFFSNSESQSFTHSVVLNTTTTVTATPANAFQNDQVTFSATVARTSAGATPTGTVTFFNGNTQIGTAVTLVNGVATLQTTFANAGSQNISAQYSGNNGVTSTSEGTITKQISETQTSSTVVTSSAIAAANGSPVTFTATVSGQTGTPTGTVTFFDGNTQLGSAVTLVNGVATMQTSTLSNGNHFIRAEYTSNSNAYGNSTSTKLNQRVNQAPAITSLGSDSFLIGTSRTFNFTATGFPAPSFSTQGILPKGLHLSSDGVLTGVPATGTGGIYSFTVVASN